MNFIYYILLLLYSCYHKLCNNVYQMYNYVVTDISEPL
jgi:hypothetical protein